MGRRPPLAAVARGALAGAPAIGLAVAWATLAPAARTTLLAHLLYWAMPAVLVLWIAAGVRLLRGAAAKHRAWFVRNAAGLAVAAAATAVAFVVSPPAMRMQFDETSLLGTSQSMHTERIAMMATGAVPSPGGPWVTDWNLDKRPPLFPFLVSVVHDLTGYRIGNAFAANGCVLFLLLALLACRARRSGGVVAAMAAPVLVLAVPLVVVCATCAGFELLAVWLLALVVLAAIDFVHDPTPARANWLFASGLVFAQARYESVFVLAVVGGLVALAARRWPRDGLGRCLLAVAPTLLAPVVLLLLHSRNPDFYVESGGRALASFAHFADHLPAFLLAWCDPARTSPFPGVLAIASVALFGGWLWRRRGGIADGLVVAPVAAATAIVLFWFYGGVGEPTAVRLYLPAAVLGALGPLLLPHLSRRPFWSPLVLAFAVAFAAWRLPAVHDGRVLPRHAPAVALDAVDAALAGLRPDPQRTLLVSTVAQYLIVRGLPAMSPVAFGKRGPGPRTAEVVVLETPLDAQLARQVGDPRDVLRSARATLLGRIEGDLPVAAWRLER